MAFVSIC